MVGVNHKEAKKRLQELIIDSRSKSLRAFALSINVDPSLLAKVIGDQRILTDSMVKSIVEKYKVNEKWLLYGEGEKYGQNGTNGSNGTTALTGTATIHDYKDSIEKRIAEIEARRLEAVARAEEIKAMYNAVQQEKGVLYDIIKENLTQLMANSNKHLAYLEKILLVDRADHETTMDSLDRIEHQPVGSNSKRAGIREVEASKSLRKKGKSGQGGVNRSSTGQIT